MFQPDLFRDLPPHLPVHPTPRVPPVVPASPVPAPKPRSDAEICLDLARSLLRAAQCPELAGRVQVRWNSRMRSTAGVAHLSRSLVVLNPRLQQFGDLEIDRTLRHELAHLLAY